MPNGCMNGPISAYRYRFIEQWKSILAYLLWQRSATLIATLVAMTRFRPPILADTSASP